MNKKYSHPIGASPSFGNDAKIQTAKKITTAKCSAAKTHPLDRGKRVI
jgi:hypothetical protein